MHIFVDGFSRISLSNNNLRIALVQNGPDSTQVEVGTLIIPVNLAGGFVNGMASSLKQIEEQIKAKAKEAKEKEGKEDLQ